MTRRREDRKRRPLDPIFKRDKRIGQVNVGAMTSPPSSVIVTKPTPTEWHVFVTDAVGVTDDIGRTFGITFTESVGVTDTVDDVLTLTAGQDSIDGGDAATSGSGRVDGGYAIWPETSFIDGGPPAADDQTATIDGGAPAPDDQIATIDMGPPLPIPASRVDGGTSLDVSRSLYAALLDASPLVMYQFSQDSGTSVTDLSGNTRTGTLAGTYTLANVTGPDGVDYITFSDGRCTIPDENAFDLTASSGLAIVVVYRRSTGGTYLVNKGGTGSDYEFAINTGGSNGVTGTVYSEAGGNRSTATTGSPNANVGDWNVGIVVVPDYGVLTQHEHYLNSSTDAAPTMSNSTSDAFDPTPTNDIWIGDRADGAAGHFEGEIAFVAIYDDADMTQAKVNQIMASAEAQGWF